MGRVLAFPRPKSVVALLAVAALLLPQGCSRESTTVLEGVIVGIEAHVPGRPVSLTIDPTEGETTTIDVPERGGYGVPADQLYEWVDER